MLQAILGAKRLAMIILLILLGYASAQLVISSTRSGATLMALVVLSATLTMLFTPVWYIPWIRSLGLPGWLVAFLPTTAMYLVVVQHYSEASISPVFVAGVGALCLVPAALAWLVSVSLMRRFQQKGSAEKVGK